MDVPRSVLRHSREGGNDEQTQVLEVSNRLLRLP